MYRMRAHIIFFLVLVTLVVSSCTGDVFGPTPVYYLPPTAAATPTVVAFPTPVPTREIGKTPENTCEDVIEFLGDVTIPDGTEVEPGQRLDKRWQFKNSGNCNWDENYEVRLVAGPSLGAASQQKLYPARGTVDFVIRMIFTAPDEPDRYRSAWQVFDPQGESLGEPFFIEVNVIETDAGQGDG